MQKILFLHDYHPWCRSYLYLNACRPNTHPVLYLSTQIIKTLGAGSNGSVPVDHLTVDHLVHPVRFVPVWQQSTLQPFLWE